MVAGVTNQASILLSIFSPRLQNPIINAIITATIAVTRASSHGKSPPAAPRSRFASLHSQPPAVSQLIHSPRETFRVSPAATAHSDVPVSPPRALHHDLHQHRAHTQRKRRARKRPQRNHRQRQHRGNNDRRPDPLRQRAEPQRADDRSNGGDRRWWGALVGTAGNVTRGPLYYRGPPPPPPPPHHRAHTPHGAPPPPSAAPAPPPRTPAAPTDSGCGTRSRTADRTGWADRPPAEYASAAWRHPDSAPPTAAPAYKDAEAPPAPPPPALPPSRGPGTAPSPGRTGCAPPTDHG